MIESARAGLLEVTTTMIFLLLIDECNLFVVYVELKVFYYVVKTHLQSE